jgi:hypothetical protein
LWFDEPALSSAEGLITNEINHLPFVLSYSKSNLVRFYSIKLQLKSGAAYPLFSPGRFFEGG